MTSVGVVVVGAGAGTRLGAETPKAFVPVAGELMLVRALRGAARTPRLRALVAVVPADRVADAESLCRAVVSEAELVVVAGGASREESVAAGLAALPRAVDTVLVHDAARTLTPASVFERVVAAVSAAGTGVIPVLPVTDTIKAVEGDSVLRTLERSELVAVQTPQGFPRAMLVDAYARAEPGATDDAGTVEAAGYPVRVVDGDPLAFKITGPDDLARAEALLRSSGHPSYRTGSGFDAHRFSPGTPLWLAGLHWPDEDGLAGHSDGDVVCHALCDALLSAVGAGDLGSVFGTADPALAGAHGERLVRETVSLVRTAGWEIDSASVQLVAARPRLASRRAEAQDLLSEWIGCAVSVSATTTDGMGFTGAGEGAAALATALVHRRP